MPPGNGSVRVGDFMKWSKVTIFLEWFDKYTAGLRKAVERAQPRCDDGIDARFAAHKASFDRAGQA